VLNLAGLDFKRQFRTRLSSTLSGFSMERNRILGLICGYYLSKFDSVAYDRLGHDNKNETHAAIARSLDVPPNTIKNWRDEFDPIHDNPRQGWHQRPMTRSRIRTDDALSHLTEFELYSIVFEILHNPVGSSANELVQVIGDETDDSQQQTEYGLRGPTGHAAEKLFEIYHETNQQPLAGALVDCRHEQCGYDYRIDTDSEHYFIEVKGLAAESGGITFTNKEWQTAIDAGDRYYLVVVKNIDELPEYVIIQNPSDDLDAKMRVYTTIQTSWTARIAR